MTMKGRCQCGAVTFEVTDEPVVSGLCYCCDCQKASGAPHVMHVAFPAAAVKVSGTTSSFRSQADSGATVTREFCPTCGSRLFGSSSAMPSLRTVHAAALDEASALRPMMAVYTKRVLAWDRVEEGLPAFEAMPPRP